MGTDVMTIRPFELGDVIEAADLEVANQPRPWSRGIFEDELVADTRSYLIAEQGDIIGFGGVMVVGDEAHITNLLVAPSHRRRGVATRLVAGLIDDAITLGARHLTLEVRAANKAAQRLYSRFGLAPVGLRPGYYDDDDALVMWAHDIDSVDYSDGFR